MCSLVLRALGLAQGSSGGGKVLGSVLGKGVALPYSASPGLRAELHSLIRRMFIEHIV